MGTRKGAVVLLSGGLDSYTAAAIVSSQGFELYALTVSYGQIHSQELESARKVGLALGVRKHLELAVDLSSIGGSSLTGEIPVPKNRSFEQKEIPVTYVPARNTIFLALALGWAEVLEVYDLVLGVNAIDYSGYPDCRPEFVREFEILAALATKAGVEGMQFRVQTPLINLTKVEIIQRGFELGLDYELTHSCYDPEREGKPCGSCDSCRLRASGFEAAGLPDPLTAKYNKKSNG